MLPGKCEKKREIGKCTINPWRMMTVCKKSCYCEGNGPKGVKLLPLCDSREDIKFTRTQELFDGSDLIFSNSTKFLIKEKNENLVKGIKKDNLMSTKRLVEKVAKMIEKQPYNSDEFICANEDVLNEEFQNCFRQNFVVSSKSNFRTLAACQLTYFSENNFQNCIWNNTLKLDTHISCRYSGLNDKELETWVCLLELSTESQNCTSQVEGTPNLGRYLFMYKFSVPLLHISSPKTTALPFVDTNIQTQSIITSIEQIKGSNNSDFNSTAYYGKLKTTSDSESISWNRYTVVIVVSVVIFIFVSLVLLLCYGRLKVLLALQSKSRSVPDNLHAIDPFVNPPTSSGELERVINVSSLDDDSVLSVNNCQDCLMLHSLPSAIQRLPDMLYPRCSINIEEGIGYGNFGAVFKGNLRLGKAR